LRKSRHEAVGENDNAKQGLPGARAELKRRMSVNVESEIENSGGGDDTVAAANGVEVKGWRNGLLLLVPPTGDWAKVLEQTGNRLDEAKARSFWRGAQTTIVCGARPVSASELGELIDYVKRAYGLVPVALVAQDAATREAGERLVLVAYSELPAIKKPAPRDIPGANLAQPMNALPPAPPPSGANALYVPQTVRSGRRIVHEGNVVVAGDVNAGAEIIAGGDVVVFGTLRGLAHAGAQGDESARILAGSLRPPQLRIAGKIARSPEEAGKGGQAARAPEVARIENGEIQVSPA